MYCPLNCIESSYHQIAVDLYGKYFLVFISEFDFNVIYAVVVLRQKKQIAFPVCFCGGNISLAKEFVQLIFRIILQVPAVASQN